MAGQVDITYSLDENPELSSEKYSSYVITLRDDVIIVELKSRHDSKSDKEFQIVL